MAYNLSGRKVVIQPCNLHVAFLSLPLCRLHGYHFKNHFSMLVMLVITLYAADHSSMFSIHGGLNVEQGKSKAYFYMSYNQPPNKSVVAK